MLKRINPASIMTPASPYSHGIELPPGTRILYCAGQVGTTKDGTTPSDLVQQNEIAWANIRAILNDAGMDLKDIVRMNAYLTSREGIEPFRAVRNRMVGKVKPASTLVLVAGLAGPQWHVEIEVVAAQASRAAAKPAAAKKPARKAPAKKSAKKKKR
ncbi:MAG: RidA family protein [Alphaproteobacteria bacterium]